MLGISVLYLKREDMHPFGSHKGRSIPEMIQIYQAQGIHDFVISSSGNAALAAIFAIHEPSTLKVFIGKNIAKQKHDRLLEAAKTKPFVHIEQVDSPKQHAFQVEKKGEAKNLRQSTDDTALVGYKSLAEELKEIPNLSAVFIPTSSGTTAQALGTFLPTVQIHIVQTEAVHPIAEVFDREFTKEEKSFASAIVDIIAHRKDTVVSAIKNSGGFGWIVSDQDIREAISRVATAGTHISANSALSIAGLQKAIARGWQWQGAVACLVTGA